MKLGALRELLKELWVTCLVHSYVNNRHQGSGPASVPDVCFSPWPTYALEEPIRRQPATHSIFLDQYQ